MTLPASRLPAALVCSLLSVSLAAAFAAADPALVESAERKIQHIQRNGELPRPDPTPTQLSEQELNAYLASGRLRLPAGVKSVRFAGTPGVITARARVDFDEIRTGQRNSNPLLSLFRGVHEVVVVAQGRGVNHKGYVDVQSVSLDGTQIPNFLLELFIEKYLSPKYPGIGMNSQFALASKIETATVGQQKLTVVQK
jgi:hypothetical protein